LLGVIAAPLARAKRRPAKGGRKRLPRWKKRDDGDRVTATARCIGDELNAVGIARHPLASVISLPIHAGGVSSLSQFQPPGALLHNLLIIMDEAGGCSNEEGNFHR
jgi:hypothetical protein